MNVKVLVDRFLQWKLPASVCSDTCVSDRSYVHSRSGTNLLDVNEARQMIEYLMQTPIVPRMDGTPLEQAHWRIHALREALEEIRCFDGYSGDAMAQMAANALGVDRINAKMSEL